MEYSDRLVPLCVSRGRASITSSCRLHQLSHKLTLGPRLVVSSVCCVSVGIKHPSVPSGRLRSRTLRHIRLAAPLPRDTVTHAPRDTVSIG